MKLKVNITMRLYLIALSFFFVIATYAQDSVQVMQTDTVEVNQEILQICQQLKIPYNECANKDLLVFALDWVGTPYAYGGSTKRGTDCSGFTTNLYTTLYGKKLPRSSRDIHSKCMPIKKHALYEGDLVFFATGGGGVSHVGVYLWDGYFVHSSTSNGVIISRLKEAYYKRTFVSGGAWLE